MVLNFTSAALHLYTQEKIDAVCRMGYTDIRKLFYTFRISTARGVFAALHLIYIYLTVKHHEMKKYVGMAVELHAFLISLLHRGEWSVSCPSNFTPPFHLTASPDSLEKAYGSCF
jgi:hypothetical protein